MAHSAESQLKRIPEGLSLHIETYLENLVRVLAQEPPEALLTLLRPYGGESAEVVLGYINDSRNISTPRYTSRVKPFRGSRKMTPWGPTPQVAQAPMPPLKWCGCPM